MQDSYGREIQYVRVSVTDRCNLRCRYCMPEEGVEKKQHADILSFDDILRVCSCFATMGINRVKVTGGEPLVRKGVVSLIAALKQLSGIEKVTLTTNGILLPSFASGIKDAAIDGVNISLDTLDPDKYRILTRGGNVADVLAGLDAALAVGIAPVKINCVPVKGVDAGDILRVAALARTRPVHVRFIEMMPMGKGAEFTAPDRSWIRAILEEAYGVLASCDDVSGNGPAKYYRLADFLGRIGFIDTLDHGLCGRCNRLRLTSDGTLKACLHMDRGVSLKPALANSDDVLLEDAVRRAIAGKPRHHAFSQPTSDSDSRSMSEIGG